MLLTQILIMMKHEALAATSGSVEMDACDRRKYSRFRAMSTIRFPNADLFGLQDVRTEDVSCRGFSFLSRTAGSPGAGFYCDLLIPEPGSGLLALLCRARVVSTASRAQGLYRVGCRIEDYSILPDTAVLPS